MRFRLVPKSVTLNDLVRRNGPHFALFCRIRYSLGALRKVVEDVVVKSSRSLSHLLMRSCFAIEDVRIWVTQPCANDTRPYLAHCTTADRRKGIHSTIWLCCMECPQYSIRLEALGYLHNAFVLVSRDTIVDRQFVTVWVRE